MNTHQTDANLMLDALIQYKLRMKADKSNYKHITLANVIKVLDILRHGRYDVNEFVNDQSVELVIILENVIKIYNQDEPPRLFQDSSAVEATIELNYIIDYIIGIEK